MLDLNNYNMSTILDVGDESLGSTYVFVVGLSANAVMQMVLVVL